MAEVKNPTTVKVPKVGLDGKVTYVDQQSQAAPPVNSTVAAKAAAFDAVSQPAPPQPATPSPDVQTFAQGKADANQSVPTVRNLFAGGKPQFASAVVPPSQMKVNAPKSETSQPVVKQPRQLASFDANSPTGGMDAITAMYTSPEDEERMRRASVANQRIMAVADALRHIGNIYHTVNYAPAQQFNNPALEEQQRYLQGKAVRDKANQTYLTYQQQKAAQDAKAKQWEADYNLKLADAARKAGLTEAQIKNMQDRLAAQKAYQEGSLKLRGELGTAQQKERERHNKVSERQGQQRIGIASQNSRNAQEYRQWKMNGGGGSGSKQTNTIYSRRGFLTKKGASTEDMKRIYDNLYEYGKSHGSRGKDGKIHPHIDEGGILAGISPDLYGGKKISDVAKREAVDKMMMEHDDAAVLLARKYGFTWHEQEKQQGTDDWSQYAEDAYVPADDEEEEDWNDYLID